MSTELKNINDLAAARPYPWNGISHAIDDNFKLVQQKFARLESELGDRLDEDFLDADALKNLLKEKQDRLIPGKYGNIKTINGQSILGPGDLKIIPDVGVLYRSFFLFKHHEEESAPLTPKNLIWNPDATTGDGLSGLDGGWSKSDNVEPPVWLTVASFSSIDPTNPVFTPPVKISGKDGENGADGNNIEFLYMLTDATMSDPPYIPKSVTKQEAIETYNWTDHPTGISVEYPTEWMTMRVKDSNYNNGKWSDWTDPAPWSHWGTNGMDGDGVQYIFKVTVENYNPVDIMNPTPADWNNDKSDYQKNTGEWYPSDKGWTDNPSGVDSIHTREWVSKRTRHDGVWGRYSDPKLWAHYSKEVKETVTEYAISDDGQVPPYDKSWKPNSPAVNKEFPYLWKRYKTVYSDNTSFPSRTGNPEHDWIYEMIGRQGEKGIDGMDVLYIYCLTNDKYTAPEAPAFQPGTEPTDKEPGKWTDDPMDVNSKYKAQWVSVCRRKNEVWEPWSTPALWSMYSGDGVTVDLDNEMACVVSNTKGELRNPELNTAETNVFMHLGSKLITIESIDILTDVDKIFIGCEVTVPVGEDPRSKRIAFTINKKVDGKDQKECISPENNVISFRVTGYDQDESYDNRIRYVGFVSFAFNKVVLGDNAILYQLHPEYGNIKKHGKAVDGKETFEYLPGSIFCSLKRVEGGKEGAEIISTKQGLDSYNAKIQEDEGVKAGGYSMTYEKILLNERGEELEHFEKPYNPGDPITLSNTESIKEVKFYLYYDFPETPEIEKTPIDKESILVVNDGVDGNGLLYIFHLTKEGDADKETEQRVRAELQKELNELTPGVEPNDPTTDEGKVYRWTDNQQGVNKTYLFEWVSMSKYDGKAEKWSPWSPPKIWNKYVKAGDDYITLPIYTTTPDWKISPDSSFIDEPLNFISRKDIYIKRDTGYKIYGLNNIPTKNEWTQDCQEEQDNVYVWSCNLTFQFVSDQPAEGEDKDSIAAWDKQYGYLASVSTIVRITGRKGDVGADGDGMYYLYCSPKGDQSQTKNACPAMPPKLDGDIHATPTYGNLVVSREDQDKAFLSGVRIENQWTESPQGVDKEHQVEWMISAEYYIDKAASQGEKIVKKWSNWRGPTEWSVFGEKGQDGDGVRYAFILKHDISTDFESWGFPKCVDDSSQSSSQVPIGKPSTVKGSWSDDSLGTDKEWKVEYVSIAKKINGDWGTWSKPTPWSKYSLDGSFEVRAYLNNNTYSPAPSAPTGTPDNPGGNWSTKTLSPSEGNKYVWVSVRKYNGKTESWGYWETPSIFATYIPGKPGAGGGRGAMGPMIRMRGDWSKTDIGTNFYQGNSGESYLDLVMYNHGTEKKPVWKKYRCTRSHAKTSTDWNRNKGNFEEAQEFEFVATDLLMSDDILAKRIQVSSGDYITDLFGTVKGTEMSTRITVNRGQIVFQYKKRIEKDIPENWKTGIVMGLVCDDRKVNGDTSPELGYCTLTFFDKTGRVPLYDLGPRGMVARDLISPAVEGPDSVLKKNAIAIPDGFTSSIGYGYYSCDEKDKKLINSDNTLNLGTAVYGGVNGAGKYYKIKPGNFKAQLENMRFAICSPIDFYYITDSNSVKHKHYKIVNRIGNATSETDPGMSGVGSSETLDSVRISCSNDPNDVAVCGPGTIGSVACADRTKYLMYSDIKILFNDNEQIQNNPESNSYGLLIKPIRYYANCTLEADFTTGVYANTNIFEPVVEHAFDENFNVLEYSSTAELQAKKFLVINGHQGFAYKQWGKLDNGMYNENCFKYELIPVLTEYMGTDDKSGKRLWKLDYQKSSNTFANEVMQEVVDIVNSLVGYNLKGNVGTYKDCFSINVSQATSGGYRFDYTYKTLNAWLNSVYYQSKKIEFPKLYAIAKVLYMVINGLASGHPHGSSGVMYFPVNKTVNSSNTIESFSKGNEKFGINTYSGSCARMEIKCLGAYSSKEPGTTDMNTHSSDNGNTKILWFSIGDFVSSGTKDDDGITGFGTGLDKGTITLKVKEETASFYTFPTFVR